MVEKRAHERTWICLLRTPCQTWKVKKDDMGPDLRTLVMAFDLKMLFGVEMRWPSQRCEESGEKNGSRQQQETFELIQY